MEAVLEAWKSPFVRSCTLSLLPGPQHEKHALPVLFSSYRLSWPLYLCSPSDSVRVCVFGKVSSAVTAELCLQGISGCGK